MINAVCGVAAGLLLFVVLFFIPEDTRHEFFEDPAPYVGGAAVLAVFCAFVASCMPQLGA